MYKNAYAAEKASITLPLFDGLSLTDQDYILAVLKKALNVF